MLLAAANSLVAECYDDGHIIKITPTKNDNTVVLSNSVTRKVLLLGIIEDEEGNDKVGACTVNVRRFCWAEDEGFCMNDIVKNNALLDNIFKPVIGQENIKQALA